MRSRTDCHSVGSLPLREAVVNNMVNKLTPDEKVIVYEVLRTEYDIENELAKNYVESYVKPTNLRLVAKEIAATIGGVV